jgi:Fe2+ transport system protein B
LKARSKVDIVKAEPERVSEAVLFSINLGKRSVLSPMCRPYIIISCSFRPQTFLFLVTVLYDSNIDLLVVALLYLLVLFFFLVAALVISSSDKKTS